MTADRIAWNGADASAFPSNPVLSFWSDYFERTGEQSKAFVEGLRTMLDPQKLQQRWLDALGQNFDEFMRSPAFLEMMRQNLKVVTDLKKAQDKAIEESARHLGAPLASDIHGLFERLAILERALSDRLESIETKLAAIETNLSSDGGERATKSGTPGKTKVRKDRRRATNSRPK